ncbi:MAG: hypothetical protein JSS14_21890 [Proteobacteria bacterium]|nr:hypothetical protein [Pseudomonadota bacterium]
MTSGELLDRLRLDLDDLEEPQLWSDEELYSYIDDAQKMFCRKTDGLPDATTPAVTQLAVAPGNSYQAVHKAILKIRGVSRADDGRPVEVVNYEDLAAKCMRYDGNTGRVRALVIGEENHKARTWPVSNETVTLNLLVFRLPLVKVEDDQEMEVDEVHHLHLLDWSKRMAYLKEDADTFNKTKAAEHEQRFLGYCAEVKEEERRKAHKPRTVAYGGI